MMKNFGQIGQLMKQAQEMQKKMEEAQQKLADIEVTGVAGGGMVKITLNGKGKVKSVDLDPQIVNSEEKDILEDLIVAAVNDGRAKAEEKSTEMMSDITGDLPLPGNFKLPF